MSDLKVDGIIASTGTNTALTLQGKGSGKVAIGDGALLFPDADGSDGEFIKTDGSAALSFAAAGGGISLQVVEMTLAKATGTTYFPNDDTAPLVSEGTEVGSQAITLATSGNRVLIQGSVAVLNATSNRGTKLAIFRGTTLIGWFQDRAQISQNGHTMSIQELDSPATDGSVTYTLRMGSSESGGSAWFLNDYTDEDDGGGTLVSNVTLMELTAA
jgi:hypothetical protein